MHRVLQSFFHFEVRTAKGHTNFECGRAPHFEKLRVLRVPLWNPGRKCNSSELGWPAPALVALLPINVNDNLQLYARHRPSDVP